MEIETIAASGKVRSRPQLRRGRTPMWLIGFAPMLAALSYLLRHDQRPRT